MSLWQFLTSGLHRHPKEHMPWLTWLGQQQREVKAETQAQREAAEQMERRLRAAEARLERMRERGQT